MKTRLHNLLIALLATAAMVVSEPRAEALQQTDIVTAQRNYDDVSTQRNQLMDRLNALEIQYRGIVQKVEALKSTAGIGGRLELQNLLKRSKAVADDLDGLQARIRALDNQLAGHRSTLVGGLDQRLTALERSLGSASPSDRRKIVVELNSIRKRREAYTTPLPSAPSSRDVSSALSLADDAAHPDELMAAADELQDTEDQLRKRLGAIEAKIAELREARALARRARSFSREERFFEETDRDRVIARYEKVTSKSSGSSSPVVDRSEDDTFEGPRQDEAVATGGAGAEENFAGNNAADDADGMAPASAADPEGAFANDAPQRESQPPMTDSPTGAPVAPSAAGGADPFASRTTIVIDGGTDPSRAVGSMRRSGSNLDSQINNLEGEQKKLKAQANKLRKRARDLRKRARDAND